MDRPGRLRGGAQAWRALRSAALGLGLVLPAGEAAAQPAPADVRGVAGAWTLALEGSHRQCRLTLAVDAAGIGRALRFPATCRRALPVVADLASWSLESARQIRLLDAQGRPALAFAPAEGEAFRARTADGEVYRLERAAMTGDQALRAAPPPPQLTGVPQVTPVDPAKAPPPGTLPGLYALDRYQERAVCRLALDAVPAGEEGRLVARVLEDCRDPGIRLFDPVAWRYEAGRLQLLARRGATVTLISERPNQWRRDPEVGATLILRKLEQP